MDTTTVQGGCLCGAVRYQVTEAPMSSSICHCANCRRAAGAQSVAWMTFSRDHFAFLQGEPTRYRSSTGATWSFCGQCGSTLTYQNEERPEEIDVTTGSTDNPEAFPPTREGSEDEKVSWV